MKQIVSLVIITILLLYLIRKMNITKEGFYTLFMPKISYVSPDYKPSNITKLFNPNKYDYNPLSISYSLKYDVNRFNFIKYLAQQLIKHSPITYIELEKTKNSFEVFDSVAENKTQMGYLSSIGLYRKISKKTLEEIYFLTNFGYRQIYLIGKINGTVINLSDLENKTIETKSGTDKQIATDLIEYYGFKNTKLSVNDSLENMVNKLRNNEIDAFIYSDLFPSFSLGKQLQKYENKKLMILPIMPQNMRLFLSMYPYYQESTVDLNYMPAGYLPKKIGDWQYSLYRPYIKSIRCFNVLICNDKIKNNLIKNIMTYFYTNLKQFNYIYEKNEKLPIAEKIKITDVTHGPFFIKFHPEVTKIMNDRGLINITESELEIKENEQCTYFIDKMKCNKYNLEKYNILLNN